MFRTHLSRALLAALGVAALGGALVTSEIANAAPRIDPGFGNGPVRIDPGFGRGPTRVDPGFTKTDSGPKYTVSKIGGFQLGTKCRWVRTYNSHYRPGVAKVCN